MICIDRFDIRYGTDIELGQCPTVNLVRGRGNNTFKVDANAKNLTKCREIKTRAYKVMIVHK